MNANSRESRLLGRQTRVFTRSQALLGKAEVFEALLRDVAVATRAIRDRGSIPARWDKTGVPKQSLGTRISIRHYIAENPQALASGRYYRYQTTTPDKQSRSGFKQADGTAERASYLEHKKLRTARRSVPATLQEESNQ